VRLRRVRANQNPDALATGGCRGRFPGGDETEDGIFI
jgi:hypothetical protein